jgi:hypothetical protein
MTLTYDETQDNVEFISILTNIIEGLVIHYLFLICQILKLTLSFVITLLKQATSQGTNSSSRMLWSLRVLGVLGVVIIA